MAKAKKDVKAKAEIKQLQSEIINSAFQVESITRERDALLSEMNSIHTRYKNEIELWRNSFYNINESEFWKITKPARITVDFLKKKYRKCKKVREKHIIKQIPKVTINEGKINYNDIEESETLGGSLAVHLHLFYEDLLDEFCHYLNNIPYIFDIYVSVAKKDNIRLIKKKLKTLNYVSKIIIAQTPNKGRDIAPFWIFFKKELSQYDYLLHIHSKKSLYTGIEQNQWRSNMMSCLLGSPSLIKKISTLFNYYNVGLFFPESANMPIIIENWLVNNEIGKKLCRNLNIPFEDGHFNYPVGSFFWAKKDAVKSIFDLDLSYRDLPDEPIPNDGTILHALERVVSLAVRGNGFNNAIYEKHRSIVCLNKSKSLYRDYGAMSLYDFEKILKQYTIISFNIFDTLITRIVFKPDDIYSLIEPKAKKIYKSKRSFFDLRKEAEMLAFNTYKGETSIHHIYESFAEILKITQKEANKIKAYEIRAELDLCIPRKDMLKLFNYLKQFSSKIILISDSHLTSSIIRKILNRCGYQGWDKLIISCESGLRKDTGELWAWFKDTYKVSSHSHIHIGDSCTSDIQIPEEIGIKTAYIFSPFNNFRISDLYPKYKKYINGSPESSLIIGYIINKLLFNSPFTGIDSDLNPENIETIMIENGFYKIIKKYVMLFNPDYELLLEKLISTS